MPRLLPLAAVALLAAALPAADRPNVVVVLADDKDESQYRLMCKALNSLEIVAKATCTDGSESGI